MLQRSITRIIILLAVAGNYANAGDLTIVSPTSGVCVANDSGPVIGIAGQPADIVLSDVRVEFSVMNVAFWAPTWSIAAVSCGSEACIAETDGQGAPVLDENGHPRYTNAVHQSVSTVEDFVDFDVTVYETVPYVASAPIQENDIRDGHVVFSINVRYRCFDENGDVYPYFAQECAGLTPAPLAPVTVATVVDRSPPDVTFSAAEIATITNSTNTCNVSDVAINPTVIDAVSAVAESSILDVQNGCSVDKTFRAADTCGNAIEYVWSQFVPPTPADVTLNLDGYVCTSPPCNEDRETLTPFNSGEAVLGAQVFVEVEAPSGCVTDRNTMLYVADEQGNFPVDCALTPDRCLPLFSGDSTTEPGLYRAIIEVGACAGFTLSETLEFEVLAKPEIDFGGPYEANEGDPLVLDASGSTVSDNPALGTIVLYEWDLDGDDKFEPERGIDQVGLTVPFDTSENGTFPIGLRVTTSTGIVAELPRDCVRACKADVACETECRALGVVTVQDVSPSCSLGGPYEAFDGETVTFDQTAASPGHPTDPISYYKWTFGDGRSQAAADLLTPSHVYGFQGQEVQTFTVVLEVFDEDGSTATCQTTVTVQDAEPTITSLKVADGQDMMEGSDIIFEAMAVPGSGSDPIVNYQWTFGDGQSTDGETARQVQHVYSQSGNYEVCLIVSDSDSSVTSCIDVTVNEVSPVPAFKLASPELIQGQEARFDARESVAGSLGDPIERYNWKFTSLDNPNEAPEYRQSEGALTTVNYTFKSDGLYRVELTVWDTDSSAVTTREFFVEDAVPTAGIRVFHDGPDETVNEGEPLTLSAGTSRPGAEADPIVEYIWDFGDGTRISQTRNELGQMPQGQNHTWDDQGNGTYIVTLTVVDSDGSRATAQTQVSVTNVPPELQLYATQDRIELGQGLKFAMRHASDEQNYEDPTVVAIVQDTLSDFARVQGTWTIDGEPINPTTTITFDSIGEKVIRCTVDDGDGGESEELTATIRVTPAAPSFDVIPTQEGVEGEPLSFSLNVHAPRIGQNQFGEVALDILEVPRGARVSTMDEDEKVRVTFEWTPGFYDAGSHRLWLRAGQGENSRERTVEIRISDNGRPVAVALGGSSASGSVSIFEFDENEGNVVLEPTQQVFDVGLGASDMAFSDVSNYLFVTVPGSDRVAVIDLRGDGSVIRRIPVNTRPTGIISGGGKIWVISNGQNTISAIDPTTLKVLSTVPLTGLENPTGLVWLNAGFDGLAGARIAVVAAGNGTVGIVDPERVMQFVNPVVNAVQIGGLLTQVKANEGTERLEIADETTRRVYSVAPSDLNDSFDGSNASSYDITFAARDLLVRDGITWIAQGEALLNISELGVSTVEFIGGSALGEVVPDISTEPLLLLFGSNRIKVFEVDEDLSLTEKSNVQTTSSVRKMMTLIAPAQ